jgi:hypothetical protein
MTMTKATGWIPTFVCDISDVSSGSKVPGVSSLGAICYVTSGSGTARVYIVDASEKLNEIIWRIS